MPPAATNQSARLGCCGQFPAQREKRYFFPSPARRRQPTSRFPRAAGKDAEGERGALERDLYPDLDVALDPVLPPDALGALPD